MMMVMMTRSEIAYDRVY